MATTELAVQQIVITGIDPTYTGAVSGDGQVFDNVGNDVFLHVVNGSGGQITVTIETPTLAEGGLTIQDRTVTVDAGTDKMIGPFSSIYEAYDSDNAIDKAVHVTYSAVTSVTVAAIKL